jgi:hypothetical protein
MSKGRLDRNALTLHPLMERINRVKITRDAVQPDPRGKATLDREAEEKTHLAAEAVVSARKTGAPVVLAFGAHTIKNGMAPVLMELIRTGWVTHLATNGAGIIHDWEFAYLGESSEHVQENVGRGAFGIWDETGFYINLAIIVGAYEGLGYGESVGKMVEKEGLSIPEPRELEQVIRATAADDPARAAAAADFLQRIRQFDLSPGWMAIPHPYKEYGLQAAAYRMGVPFTSHPMFGHDIIYCHPMNHGAAIGRSAERDFLSFAEAISRMQGGVYLSVGSAVMSPMIFEKSFSMAQNLALQRGEQIENHRIFVVDLAKVSWDWQRQGEPPEDDPAYYMRFLKSFSRMGGRMEYIAVDNRLFFQRLLQELVGNREDRRE